ncbi:MAG: YciI family protein, partial [Pseudomonadota bacterium]
QGIGLIIYRADSLEAARALADGDPMHKTGARSYILRRWMINEGSLTLSVGLSTGGGALS